MKNNNKCVICSEEITADPDGWEGGCNAEPVAEGQCCYKCDMNVVLPVRLEEAGIPFKDFWSQLNDIVKGDA